MMWAYLLFVFIGSTAAQVIKFGACPDVAVKPDFDVSKFIGKWYHAEHYFSMLVLTSKCNTETYSANDNGTVGVLTEQINYITGRPFSFEGYFIQNQDEKAKLSVVYPSRASQVKAASFWVVDTDYESMVVMWICENISVFSARFAWILTREQQPPASVLEKAYEVLDKNNIDRSPLQATDQVNCPKTFPN